MHSMRYTRLFALHNSKVLSIFVHQTELREEQKEEKKKIGTIKWHTPKIINKP